jgi:phosphatidylglycerol:prolipoprotein diacylglycerol transferase
MPSLYTRIGPWTFQTFTLSVALGVLASAWIGVRRTRGSVSLPVTMNAYLGALVAGAAGARLLHVLLNWDYFATSLSEATNLSAGGLDWHGAVLGGIAGLWVAVYGQSWWERHITSPPKVEKGSIRFNMILDSLALALPIVGLGAWYGCLAAGCGYGREVDTLANYSPWVASELVDVFGIVAPRFNTPYFGMILSGLVLVIVTLWERRTRGSASRLRFWFALGLLSGGMFVIGFFRGDRTPVMAGLRADQALDLLCVAISSQLFQKGSVIP